MNIFGVNLKNTSNIINILQFIINLFEFLWTKEMVKANQSKLLNYIDTNYTAWAKRNYLFFMNKL